MRALARPLPSLAVYAALVSGAALADPPEAERIDCWAAEESLLESAVCDDPVLRDLDDALAEKLSPDPGAMVALRAGLAAACALPADAGEPDAIGRLERAGCLAPRYREALATHGLLRDAAAPLPPDMVHPLCLGMTHALWGEPEVAELPMQTCRSGTGHIPVSSDPDGTLFAQGLSVGSPTFVAYTPLGPLPDGRPAALIRQNTGGTGVFSAVIAYTVGPTLTVETLVQGGDRCNGGISAARLDGSDWIVAFDITPIDIAEVIGAGEDKAMDDLPSCAICCAASLEIRFPPAVEGEGDILSLHRAGDGPATHPQGRAESCLLEALGPDPVPASAFPAARARFEGCLSGAGRSAP
jgi:hypothetical protein